MEKAAQNTVSYNAKRLGGFLVIFVILIMSWNFHIFLPVNMFLIWIPFLSMNLFTETQQNLYYSKAINQHKMLNSVGTVIGQLENTSELNARCIYFGRERECCTNTLLLQLNQTVQNFSMSPWHSFNVPEGNGHL